MKRFPSIKKEILFPLIRESWSLAWPMTLIMLFEFFIGLSDVYVAGRIGKEVQAAYGLAFQIYFIFIVVGLALSVGTVSVVSQLFTAPDKRGECENAVLTSVLMTAVFGAMFTLAGIVSARAIVRMSGIPSELHNIAGPLLRIYSIGFIFDYILISTNGILRATGSIRRSLVSMTAVCALNVSLNFALALGTPLGADGIAWATVISLSVGAAMNLFYIRGFLHIGAKFTKKIMANIIAVSWPSGILQAVWQLGAMALFMIIARLPENSVEIMAALTNGLKIESVIFLVAFAFNMANSVVVGNSLGREDRKNAFLGGIVTAVGGVAAVLILTALTMLNARFIAGHLSGSDIVVMESIRYITIALLSEPIMAWGVILAGGLNGAGDTRSVMVFSAISVWLVRIPLCYLFGIHMGFGAVAIWWSMNASILVHTALVTVRFFAKRWMPGHLAATARS